MNIYKNIQISGNILGNYNSELSQLNRRCTKKSENALMENNISIPYFQKK